MQKVIKLNLVGTLSWNDFKIKLNDKFTLFNQILKDGQEWLNLHQSKGHGTLVCYVQAFSALLNLVTMKEKYVHKVTFLHHLQLWAHKSIFQKNGLKTFVKKWWKW